ncbi:MAG: DUF58 domain-containing protein [Alphaproteobacteria bacterium]
MARPPQGLYGPPGGADPDGPARALRLRETAEGLARALPPLLVAADHLAMSMIPGVHGRRRAGPGETFWQYRRYGEGDSAASIDWRQSARAPALYVRENEWEAAQTVYFWTDGSPSMDYASRPELETKHHRAAVIALALAQLLTRAGERVALLDGRTKPAAGEAAVRRMAEHMTRTPSLPLGEIPSPDRLPRGSRVVLVSDFLMDLDILARRLRDFGGGGSQGHLFHVFDPAEEDLPFTGRTEFEDMEDFATLTLGRTEAVRDDYLERVRRHRAALTVLAGRWRWTVTPHRTDAPAGDGLRTLYGLISGAGRGRSPTIP